MSEQEKSVALVGPQSEYNPRGLPPTRTEVKEVCSQMAEMERKYQESAALFAKEWRTANGIPQ